MYHLTYDEKTKKNSYKIELVPKIDAERKHMQEGYIYADKDLNSKEENKKLEKFLNKNKKIKIPKIKNQFFTPAAINEINRKNKPFTKLSKQQQRMKNYDTQIKTMNKKKQEKILEKMSYTCRQLNQDTLSTKYKIKNTEHRKSKEALFNVEHSRPPLDTHHQSGH